jgi:phenazine biosynthesis protein phzE
MNPLEQLLDAPAFALIKIHGTDEVLLLAGAPVDFDHIADIPLQTGAPDAEELGAASHWDWLVAVPYAQIRERGFEAIDDGTPLRAIKIDQQTRISLDDLFGRLPEEPIETRGQHGFDIADDDYEKIVDRVIREEIGNGEGANLVIARNYRAQIVDWSSAKALTCLRRLIADESGAYWTFLVFTGDRYLIGASPERHVLLTDGEARMNPISGTFRVGPDDGDRKKRLLDFLADEKEIYELFMVVDEELKLMCDICSSGGTILGPYLKPMTHLIHTEYVLAGRTSMDVREVLRRSMWAATVTGSPVENACRLIAEYEPGGRAYYGAVLALIGRDVTGRPTLDAPILLRTADVSPTGVLRVGAGATLVRDSDPAYEVAETHAKAGGILSAFGLVPRAPASADEVAALADDPEVQDALVQRNRRLSEFWFKDQMDTPRDPRLEGKHAVVLDGEDDFVNMLMHMFGVLGMTSERIRHSAYQPGRFAGADLVIVGPGPGDPRQLDEAKIAAVRRAVDDLLESGQPFLAVCLGHQVLCGALGLPLTYKDIVFQGTQTDVELRLAESASATDQATSHRVGFYNTFVARADQIPEAVIDSRIRFVDTDCDAGDVHHLAGGHFHGIQFHAESILSEDGFDLVRALVTQLLTETPD